jgi:hypothetical protein
MPQTVAGAGGQGGGAGCSATGADSGIVETSALIITGRASRR